MNHEGGRKKHPVHVPINHMTQDMISACLQQWKSGTPTTAHTSRTTHDEPLWSTVLSVEKLGIILSCSCYSQWTPMGWGGRRRHGVLCLRYYYNFFNCLIEKQEKKCIPKKDNPHWPLSHFAHYSILSLCCMVFHWLLLRVKLFVTASFLSMPSPLWLWSGKGAIWK